MNRKPKVLFLHGYGESSVMAGMSAAALKRMCELKELELLHIPNGWIKLKTDFEFMPVDDPEYREMCKSGELEAFAWWRPRDHYGKYGKGDPQACIGYRRGPDGEQEPLAWIPHAEEAQDATEKLVQYIDQRGGVDCIVGFGQGGELAMLLAEEIGEGESGRYNMKFSSRQKLKLIATFGSEDPWTKRGHMPNCTMPPPLRFLICHGEHDAMAIRDGETMDFILQHSGAAMIAKHKVNGLDHHMPKPKDPTYETLATLILGAVHERPIPPEYQPKPTDYNYPGPNQIDIGAKTKVEYAFEQFHAVQMCSPMGGPVDEHGNHLMNWFEEHPKTDMDRRIEETLKANNPDKEVLYSTWTIPKDAPPGWGRGHGAKYLRENPWPD